MSARCSISHNICICLHFPCVFSVFFCYIINSKWFIWVRSRRYDCLVTWFCYQLIAKPGKRQPHLRDLTHMNDLPIIFRFALLLLVASYNHSAGRTIQMALTHLPLDKMAAISQTIFSDAFPLIKFFVFLLKFHWSLFLRVQLTIT